MKAIVIYDSWTGNTERVAQEIAKGLDCRAVFVKEIKKYKTGDYDLIVVGTPVHGARPTRKITKILEEIEEPKYCAVFCTYGAPIWGKLFAEKCLNFMEKRLKAKCIGRFKCLGFHRILRTYRNRPNEEDLRNAKEFGKRLLKRSKKEMLLSD